MTFRKEVERRMMKKMDEMEYQAGYFDHYAFQMNIDRIEVTVTVNGHKLAAGANVAREQSMEEYIYVLRALCDTMEERLEEEARAIPKPIKFRR